MGEFFSYKNDNWRGGGAQWIEQFCAFSKVPMILIKENIEQAATCGYIFGFLKSLKCVLSNPQTTILAIIGS